MYIAHPVWHSESIGPSGGTLLRLLTGDSDPEEAYPRVLWALNAMPVPRTLIIWDSEPAR